LIAFLFDNSGSYAGKSSNQPRCGFYYYCQ
jgi:hypothetical protein